MCPLKNKKILFLRSFCLILGLIILVIGNHNFILFAKENQKNPKILANIELHAPSAILMEASTGTILYEKDPDTPRPPASVTKIMTMLLIFDALEEGKIHLDDTVPVSEHAASMGGSQVFLEVGETQSVDTMLKCISVASANDACVCMAEYICGSEEEFVRQMNQRAKELGMNHTTFINCNGLDADGHETSARDIAFMIIVLSGWKTSLIQHVKGHLNLDSLTRINLFVNTNMPLA